MLAYHNQFVAILYELLGAADIRTERLNLRARTHVDIIVEARLPETFAAVLQEVVEVLVTAGNGELAQLAIVRQREGAVAGGAEKHRTVLALDDGADTWRPSVREAVVNETAGGRIVTVQSAVRAHP